MRLKLGGVTPFNIRRDNINTKLLVNNGYAVHIITNSGEKYEGILTDWGRKVRVEGAEGKKYIRKKM